MSVSVDVSRLKSVALPALLKGTRGDGLSLESLGPAAAKADSAKIALKMLSLCGQAIRFEAPAAPAELAIDPWPRDERRIVPDDLRPMLLRLLAEKRPSQDTELAVALTLARLKLRVHTFDLPALDAFVKSHAEHLGKTAQYWAQREAPPTRQRGYFDADPVDERNWGEAPLAARARFLEEFRGRDAGAARAALEAVWPRENADARVRLLAALQRSLSLDDKPFLGGLAKDRAPRVRTLAARLLAWLPGSEGENPALTECLSRIEKTRSGLLIKRPALKLQLPATVKDHEASRWVKEQFADVGLDELARALEMPLREMIEAAEKDANLLLAFALMASTEKRWELLAQITEGPLPDAWGKMCECAWGTEELAAFSAEERANWASAVVRPRQWMPVGTYGLWSWLQARIEGPLPATVMSEVLRAKEWTEQLASDKPPAAEHLQAFGALCPPELRPALRKQMEPLDGALTEKPTLLLDILDRLEKLG